MLARMSFFDSLTVPELPDDDEVDDFEPPPWAGPTSGVLGVAVPSSEVLVRTEHVAVVLTRVTAYPSGCSLVLQVAVRRGDWGRDRWRAAQELFWSEGGFPGGGGRPGDALRLGVELADGSRTSTYSGEGWRDPDDEPPRPPVLSEYGGGGGVGSGRILESTRELWLWPLPDGATLDLVADWQALDVPVSRLVLDASPLREAAASAASSWPDEPRRPDAS